MTSNCRSRFSLSTMLLWVAILGLIISNALTLRQLSQVQPASSVASRGFLQEVARQFEEQATNGLTRVSVTDVRYSPVSDSIKVRFAWLDENTGQNWTSGCILNSNGYGEYSGQVRSDPYLRQAGGPKHLAVAVATNE